MKILVPVKRVADPDNANKVTISSDKSRIETKGLEWKLNPYDEYALEAALRLTENGATKERIGEVVVATLGPADAVTTLRQGLAMGADRGIVVETDDEALDTNSTAEILKALVRKEEPDLVLMGKITVDSDSNAVGQYLAEKLQWPMATLAMQIGTEDGGKSFTVGRELDTGILTLTVEGPAVITASDRIIHPSSINNNVTPSDFKYPESEGGRYASLKGIMAAKKKKVEQLNLGALDVSPELLVSYSSFGLPPSRSGSTTFVESVEELLQKLHQEAKVL